MKRIVGLLPLAFLLLFLIGCEALLTFNLFSELDTPETPSAASFQAMTDAELLSSVSDLVESETFFEDIAGNDETRSAVIGGLTEIYAAGSDAAVADKQEAAVLVAKIELNTTQAGEVVAEEDGNTGEIAQDAIVAILISEIVDTDGDRPELLSPEELEAVVVNDEPFPDDFSLENNPLEENTALMNILNASGLKDLFSA